MIPTLVLTDDYASTRHARLSPRGGDWFVEDLGSTNGTYLDRSKVTTAVRVPVGAARACRQDGNRAAPVTLPCDTPRAATAAWSAPTTRDSVYAGPGCWRWPTGWDGHAAGEGWPSQLVIAALAHLDDDEPGGDICRKLETRGAPRKLGNRRAG